MRTRKKIMGQVCRGGIKQDNEGSGEGGEGKKVVSGGVATFREASKAMGDEPIR